MRVAAGQLPLLRDAPIADAAASWRAVRIGDDGRVRFARPLWLDFGGIAKGYCVDAAVTVLRAAGLRRGCVDAGGDLRVFGARSETVVLRDFVRRDGCQAVLALSEGALAASATPATDGASGAHIDARRRREIVDCRAVCVTAGDCVVADALTKIVLSAPARARPLRRYGAKACRSTERDRSVSG